MEGALAAIVVALAGDESRAWMSPHLRIAEPGETAACVLIGPDATVEEVERSTSMAGDPWLLLIHDPLQAANYSGTVDLVVAPNTPVAEVMALLSQPRSDIHLNLEALAGLSLLSASRAATEQALAGALGVDRAKLQSGDTEPSGALNQTLVADEMTLRNPDLTRAIQRGCPQVVSSGHWLFAIPLHPNEPGAFPRLALLSDTVAILGPRDLDILGRVARRLSLEVEADELASSLAREVDSLRQSPGVDPQLGLWNRPATESLLDGLLAGAARGQPTPSVGVIDLIDLTSINRRHGHKYGDIALLRVGALLKRTLRTEDLVGRLGGDEFVTVLTATPLASAESVLERLVESIGQIQISTPSGSFQVQATAGLSHASPKDSAAELIGRARDAADEAQTLNATVVTAEADMTTLSQPRTDWTDAPATLGGNYRLLHEISRGAMGVVYRGQDVALGRAVAVKMLRPDLVADEDFIQRFRVEASILAQLRHPNLVQIYAFGEDRDETYFVMELVEGESVEDALTRMNREGGRFALWLIRQVALDIGSALDALHARGIVHRDVKPANVVLAPFSNRAVLVDVGVAWRHGDVGQVAGTPGFIAPEAMAKSEFGPRSDLYGLAATLYAMCALQEPFPVEDDDIAGLYHRQCEDKPEPLASRSPELAPLDRVLELALHPDPNHRQASAGEFSRAFAEAISSISTIAGDEPGNNAQLPAVEKSATQAAGQVRAIVLRALPRVIGLREAERLRNDLVPTKPSLARALEPSVGALDWLHYGTFEALLSQAHAVGSQRETFAADLARATVRMSFRRFFPVSAATLDPSGSLAAIDSIWKRYHSWGKLRATPLSSNHVVVRLEAHRLGLGVLAWLGGMIQQVVVLSGGQDVRTELKRSDSSVDVTWADKSPD